MDVFLLTFLLLQQVFLPPIHSKKQYRLFFSNYLFPKTMLRKNMEKVTVNFF